MGCPGKWKQGLKPAVPWWINFDPHPKQETSSPKKLEGSFLVAWQARRRDARKDRHPVACERCAEFCQGDRAYGSGAEVWCDTLFLHSHSISAVLRHGYFHLVKSILYFPPLVVKGTYHYWSFFWIISRGLQQMEG